MAPPTSPGATANRDRSGSSASSNDNANNNSSGSGGEKQVDDLMAEFAVMSPAMLRLNSSQSNRVRAGSRGSTLPAALALLDGLGGNVQPMHACDVCGTIDEIVPTSVWCTGCAQCLCATCEGYHGRLRMTANHRLIPFDKFLSSGGDVEAESQEFESSMRSSIGAKLESTERRRSRSSNAAALAASAAAAGVVTGGAAVVAASDQNGASGKGDAGKGTATNGSTASAGGSDSGATGAANSDVATTATTTESVGGRPRAGAGASNSLSPNGNVDSPAATRKREGSRYRRETVALADTSITNVNLEVLLPTGELVTLSDVSLDTAVSDVAQLVFEAVKANKLKPLVDEDDRYVLHCGGESLFDEEVLRDLPGIVDSVNSNSKSVAKLTLKDKLKLHRDANKLATVEIGRLLNKPMSMLDLRGALDEVTVCRARFIPLIKEEIAARKLNTYSFPVNINSQPLPSSVAEELASSQQLVRFHLFNNAQHKTIKADLRLSPIELMAGLFPDFMRVNKGIVAGTEEDYMFKAYGSAEFAVGDTPMCQFEFIRKNLLRHAHVHIVLISREEAVDQERAEAMSMDANTLEDPPEYVFTSYDHAELTLNSLDRHLGVECMSIFDLNRPFKIRIEGLDKVSFSTPLSGVKDDKKAVVKMLKRAQKDSKRYGHDVYSGMNVYMTAGIYNGAEPLVPPLRTPVYPGEVQPRWQFNMAFDIAVSDIPRAARLCFSLFWSLSGEANPELDIPLAHVNCVIVDYNDHLRQGSVHLPMWKFDRANPIGTVRTNPDVNDAPVLTVHFEQFLSPVVFPQEDSSFEPEIVEPKLTDEQSGRLDYLCSTDPLFKLSGEDRELIWAHRHYLRSERKGLSKILRALPWHSRTAVREMHLILETWEEYDNALDALELLDATFMDAAVREFAVKNLERLSDDELADYMIQLVQAVKYEPYLDNPLARFLIRRSLRSRHVGHFFFWCLKSELHQTFTAERFVVYLEAFLRGCGGQRRDLLKQYKLQQDLVRVAVEIKDKEDRTREFLQERLDGLQFPDKVGVILNQSTEARGLRVEKCKYMESKKLPLWLVMENADPFGNDIYVIFKEGDDLRQDMLTLQMIRIMDKLWQQDDMDLHMKPYGAVATGDEIGMIEVVLNSDTLANIQMERGGFSGAFKDQPLREWLEQHNPSEAEMKVAVDNFVLSCAGYCVATYVLGIGDRHNDNIMLDKSGHLFHIDFGHFLGNIKRKFGVKRERTPFVFTPDMLYVMGGRESPDFRRFHDLCIRAYLCLRRNSNMFISLFAMMLSTGIPELQSPDDIEYLRDVLRMDYSEEQACRFFSELIDECLEGGWSTQLNWWIHNVVHSSSLLKKGI